MPGAGRTYNGADHTTGGRLRRPSLFREDAMKRIACFVLLFALLLGGRAYALEPLGAGALPIPAPSALLMEKCTGTVLYEKNADNKYPPSALAKLVTANLALDREMDEKVIMTEVGVAEINEESSNLYSQVGELFTVEQMAYAALLRSANDLTTELAYHVGGDSVCRSAVQLCVRKPYFAA